MANSKYLLDTSSDSDYDSDFDSDSSDGKTYTPEELISALVDDSSKVASSYENIKIIGDVCDIKVYRGPSAAFKLKNNGKE